MARKSKASASSDAAAAPAPEPEAEAKSSLKYKVGDLVEVHENHINVHGLHRVEGLTDEGTLISPLDGSHLRIRVSPESVIAVYRQA